MESSEDDAGTATNASRRASAREKDVGLPEDTNATPGFQQEPSEMRTSCQTPAMSEDNFDGDSVPSPSTQDVNTSTEAILDMIDEICDGPGAPKRLQLEYDFIDAEHELVATTSNQNITQESNTNLPENIPLAPPVIPPDHSATTEKNSNEPLQVESLPHSDAPADITNEHSKPESSTTSQKEVSVSRSLIQEESPVNNETPNTCPVPNICSSSGEQTVQSILSVSECITQERTVKHVTSSDNRDNVTIESAESTSSDSNVSEGKSVLLEPQTRSPLRRRLVRPAPSDRRPDSTVSSTVDSQINASTTEQQSSEHIAKDVTSSSDAVPTTHGIKPEEIRNVSEINVCQAETSISPPKKIKLVRQKLIPGSSSKDVSMSQSTILSDKEQCQSTSDNHTIIETKLEPTVKDHIEVPNLDNNVLLQKENIENTEEIVCPAKHSQSSSEQPGGSLDIDKTKETLASDSISLQSGSTFCSLPDMLSTDKNQQSQDIAPEKSTPLPSLLEPTDDTVNILEPSKVQISLNTLINDSQPVISNDLVEHDSPVASSTSFPGIGEEVISNKLIHNDEMKVPPIKLNLSLSNFNESKQETDTSSINEHNVTFEDSDPTKQVPKLTIKIRQPEEVKPVPKLTIKPIKPPQESDVQEKTDSSLQVPSIAKINIKPIPKLSEDVNEKSSLPQKEPTEEVKSNFSGQVPNITKLNIKPLLKPPERINDIHRKSSSSEISESEYSENDESTSTSDQASASDHGSTDVVPKVTIKMGKPGTESEGKFYTEKNVPKLTIKNIQPDESNEQETKLKVIISQSEDIQSEKVPKFTIKTVTMSENQPLSPKLIIKPLKPPDSTSKEETAESYSSELKESPHVPRITIKPVTKTDTDARPSKKSSNASDSPDYIPIVTKLNIKPILKPVNDEDASEGSEEKVPVVSKLNIKPVIKPKDSDLDSSIDDIPKVTKLNIKPLKNPEEKSSAEKDCDESNADNSIPVITKLNIKPIVKPQNEEMCKDSENQSSETGNSSDDNTDHIPVVTKLNIKPIVKPDHIEEPYKSVATDLSIPVVTKLNIKPVVKPGENVSPSSPIKVRTGSNSPIPVVTKINIKPIVKPDEIDVIKPKEDNEEIVKNPPLVMKINMKSMAESTKNDSSHENTWNNIDTGLLTFAPQSNKKNELQQSELNEQSLVQESTSSKSEIVNEKIQTPTTFSETDKQNCVPDSVLKLGKGDNALALQNDFILTVESSISKTIPDTNSLEKLLAQSANITPSSNNVALESSISEKVVKANETDHKRDNFNVADLSNPSPSPKTKMSSVQNCTLLKKLLEKTNDSKDVSQIVNCTEPPKPICKDTVNKVYLEKSDNLNLDISKVGSVEKIKEETRNLPTIVNDIRLEKSPAPEQYKKLKENLAQPLEISISDKIATQSSGQDSPRIILKINKTDHGSSAKIITEDPIKPDLHQQNSTENAQELANNQLSPKKHVANMKKKLGMDATLNLSAGKRLRSSRIVENTDKSPVAKKNSGKRPSETSPPQNKESEVNMLQTKRLKLGQLLSNKPLSITPVTTPSQISPTKSLMDIKQSVTVNHTHILNNENCSKNGSSKLHNILSNLQAKQMQSLPFMNTNCSEKTQNIATDLELNASTSSSDLADLSAQNENSNAEVQELMINENSDLGEFANNDNASQDPLEIESSKSIEDAVNVIIPKSIELTPQPKKRGRPRKLPASEGAKPIPPVPPALPVSALEERPQRSLRLMRDRPTILAKPRGGRGRGRGGRRIETPPPAPESVARVPEPEESVEERPSGEIDPTSSRIKLPRMTEALDKMPSMCTTPLSSRRRESSGLSPETTEFKVCDSSLGKIADTSKSPETVSPARGRGRGGRGGRGRTPRGRGRGRGGGRGAVYMKETMGIYGRVCGPATTTVQLFEEETCMMDDNATPAKSSHLLDEDSQSSVKSSTNESSKMKKSKFADLFDSNKVWTAADVKEYTWPPPGRAEDESKVMMIQEQVAMFLNVKSFKRRYSELKRRTICGEERDYVLSKGLVTEALCDLGITAVDASEVLDIMLSDYPHKYEEYRSYQRQRQLAVVEEEQPQIVQSEDKTTQTENIKQEKPLEQKPEVPKVDPEKTRQDMAAAAIASASEWNARANASRRGACADLQSMTVLCARAPPAPPARTHLRPPAGFYPHALLPGQYQHTYRLYPADQLRYFPLNTVLEAPPGGTEEWSSESERDWRSDSDDSDLHTHLHKRKRLTKTKRSSQNEIPGTSKEESRGAEEVVDLCKVCKLRLEANRRYTHERFLVCANCNAKLHPSCLELNADTIRKCREYPWQCAECKTCCSCRQPADDDKMLFCDLCDRGFHIYCVGLDTVPTGRWHCVECAVCKSCGARSAWGLAGSGGASGGGGGGASGEGEAEWHHQTRRGPGGHKVYSHSLCTPCARAYRIGRYCPLCERSFIGPKGTMQLVICKLCDRQLHQECVKQTVSTLSVLDYTCAECRRGGITSRAAAVRLAPRTIATLFMAKRRFNKYAHRQYMESRQRAPDADAADLPDATDATDATADASDNSDA